MKRVFRAAAIFVLRSPETLLRGTGTGVRVCVCVLLPSPCGSFVFFFLRSASSVRADSLSFPSYSETETKNNAPAQVREFVNAALCVYACVCPHMSSGFAYTCEACNPHSHRLRIPAMYYY